MLIEMFLEMTWIFLALLRLLTFWEDDMSVVLAGILVNIIDLILLCITILLFLTNVRNVKRTSIMTLVIAFILAVVQILQIMIRRGDNFGSVFFAWLYWLIPLVGVSLIKWERYEKFLLQYVNFIILAVSFQVLLYIIPPAASLAYSLIARQIVFYYGFFVRPITTAGYATSASYVLLGLLLIRNKLSGKRVVFQSLSKIDLLATFALLFMFTRGSILVLLAWFLIAIIRKPRVKLTQVLFINIVIFIFGFFAAPVLFYRVFSEVAFDQVRARQFISALNHFVESGRYLLGNGFGTLIPRFWTSRTDLIGLFAGYAMGATHNTFVVLLDELGLLGTMIIAFIIFVFFLRGNNSRDLFAWVQLLVWLLMWLMFETNVFLPEYSYLFFITLNIVTSYSNRSSFQQGIVATAKTNISYNFPGGTIKQRK